MPTNQVACPFCGFAAENSRLDNFNIALYECETCGTYAIGPDYLQKIDKDIMTPYLFYNCNIFSQNKDENYFYFIGSQDTFDIVYKSYPNSSLVNIKEAENWYPKDFSEKINNILLALAELSDYTGKTIFLIGGLRNSLFFIKQYMKNNQLPKERIDEQFDYFTSYMKEQKLIKMEYATSAVLLPEGLKRIDELQKNKSVSKQVFIAISFSDEMIKVQEAIEEGIRKAGYIPHTMNRNEHNNQIVPEILFQIRQSKFVVSEFSTGNNGAYYEAGYAAGLGKEVIHICNTKKFKKKGHFDIKQKSTVLWNTVEEIPDALCKRIIATIF